MNERESGTDVCKSQLQEAAKALILNLDEAQLETLLLQFGYVRTY